MILLPFKRLAKSRSLNLDLSDTPPRFKGCPNNTCAVSCHTEARTRDSKASSHYPFVRNFPSERRQHLRKCYVQVGADIGIIASDWHTEASNRFGNDLTVAEYIREVATRTQT